MTYPTLKLRQEEVPESVRSRALKMGETMLATESVLPVGAKVRIVGYKGVKLDAQGEFKGYRSAPERPIIQSGAEFPVIITLETEETD